MLRKAVELGNTRRGGLASIVKPGDWVVIKVDMRPCADGSATDTRVVKSLVDWLVEHSPARKITIAEGQRCQQQWPDDWATMVADLSRRHPSLTLDFADLNLDEVLELPVPGKPSATRNRDGVYFVPRTIQQCDRLISVAPLKTHPRTGVSLSIGNYFGIAPASKYGASGDGLFQLGEPHEVLMDLFSFHTADYAILCGGAHGNMIIAGAGAPAVDAVGAAVMGIDPSGIPHLNLAAKKATGSWTSI
jgi:uncharacterized protein (DUF362 family)